MHKLIVMTLLAMFVVTHTRAQGAAPTAEPVDVVVVGAANALAFVPGGDLLLIADGTDLQLYDVATRGGAQDVVSAAMENPPTAVAATADFALTAVNTGGATDVLWVYDEDIYSRSGFSVINALDIPAGTRAISLSPDQQWGLAYGDSGFVTLQLISADNILASTLFDNVNAPIRAAALSNERALIVRQGATRIEAVDLESALAAQAAAVDELELSVGATALAVSPDNALAAVAAETNRITLFDPAALDPISTITLDDGPVAAMAFGSADDSRYLAVLIEGRAAVLLLDVTDPTSTSLPGSVDVEGSAQALAVDGARLAVSIGDAVRLFEVSGS